MARSSAAAESSDTVLPGTRPASGPPSSDTPGWGARTPVRPASAAPITMPTVPSSRPRLKAPSRIERSTSASSADGSTPRTVTTWFSAPLSSVASSALPSTKGVAETTPGSSRASAASVSMSAMPPPSTDSTRTCGS